MTLTLAFNGDPCFPFSLAFASGPPVRDFSAEAPAPVAAAAAAALARLDAVPCSSLLPAGVSGVVGAGLDAEAGELLPSEVLGRAFSAPGVLAALPPAGEPEILLFLPTGPLRAGVPLAAEARAAGRAALTSCLLLSDPASLCPAPQTMSPD